MVEISETQTGRTLRSLLSLGDDKFLALTPDGHYRGSPGIEDELVYVALTEDGVQLTLAPQEFSEKYGWKNDPEKVRLVPAGQDDAARALEPDESDTGGTQPESSSEPAAGK